MNQEPETIQEFINMQFRCIPSIWSPLHGLETKKDRYAAKNIYYSAQNIIVIKIKCNNFYNQLKMC